MLDFGDRAFILGDLFGVASKFSQFAQLQDGDALGSRSTGGAEIAPISGTRGANNA